MTTYLRAQRYPAVIATIEKPRIHREKQIDRRENYQLIENEM